MVNEYENTIRPALKSPFASLPCQNRHMNSEMSLSRG